MKQSQWTFEVHNCLCFSQRLRRFNKLLQLPNGYKSATLNENSLVCKIKQNILLQETNESLQLLGHMK